MVYPGTEAYKWSSDKGYLMTHNYREWLSESGMHNCVISVEGMTPDKLVAFCDDARKRFYFRPWYIAAKGFDVIRHPSEMKRTAKAAFSLVSHMMKR
jgi:hypothetical protein